jgi:hypothetical protein
VAFDHEIIQVWIMICEGVSVAHHGDPHANQVSGAAGMGDKAFNFATLVW